MDNTIIQQGTFESPGVPYIVELRSGIDWAELYNYDTIGTNPNPGVIQHAFWQSSMGIGTAVGTYNTDAALTLEYAAVANPLGFSVFDSSTLAPTAPIVITAGTNATRPVYDTGDTGTMITDARPVVRVTGSEHINLNGLDFTVDTVNANVDFRLANALATAPGVAATTGHWRMVAPGVAVYKMFYPSYRNIGNITQAAQAVVTTLVDHEYEIGDVVRFKVPPECAMLEINGLTGAVTAETDSTFTVNIDTTGFTPFVFPTAVPAVTGYTPAHVVPIGGDQTAAYELTGATENRGLIGLHFGQTIVGVAGNTIHWRAGRVFNI